MVTPTVILSAVLTVVICLVTFFFDLCSICISSVVGTVYSLIHVNVKCSRSPFTYILLLMFATSVHCRNSFCQCKGREQEEDRKSRSSTWVESGWSPQSDRLAPTAPQNVAFLSVLMNPEGEKNEWTWMFQLSRVLSCSTALLQRKRPTGFLFTPYIK